MLKSDQQENIISIMENYDARANEFKYVEAR